MSLITLKPVGGLCNRMRAMDSSLSLARKLDADLKVIWECNGELNCRFEELFKPIAGLGLLNVSCGGETPMPRWVRRWLHRRRYPRDTDAGSRLFQAIQRYFPYNPAETVVLNNEFSRVANRLSNEQEYANLEEFDADFIRACASWFDTLSPNQSLYLCSCYRFFQTAKPYGQFHPTDELQLMIDRHVKSFRDTVGIHIRRTDNVDSIQNSPCSLFVAAMNQEIALSPGATFYLATDDAEVKAELQQTFGDRILTHEVEYARDSTQGIRDAVVDLYCLANTRKIYGSFGSSFTHTAALIGNIERQVLKLAA